MRLWKRASGTLKDRNSIFVAALARRTSFRNPDIESAVIKATSHDESSVDYRNAHRVFTWIRMSPAYLKPFLWSICVRMDKTRSWVVALKGLILMHGVFCCKVPSVQTIGRLPFDLSDFKDGHSGASKMWAFNSFVRAYYAFIDQKSVLICEELQERKVRSKVKGKGGEEGPSIGEELKRVQQLQGLLDSLLQIKPRAHDMHRVVILEAMDCVIIEIYDIYSRICNGNAKVLLKIYSADKAEASLALQVLQKAASQGDEMRSYFEYCREFGALNASECPKIEQFPEEDIFELERIINGGSEGKKKDNVDCSVEGGGEEDRAIVAVGDTSLIVQEKKESRSDLQTIITNNWEVFDEDLTKMKVDNTTVSVRGRTAAAAKGQEPWAGPLIPIEQYPHVNHQDLPDLISFE